MAEARMLQEESETLLRGLNQEIKVAGTESVYDTLINIKWR